MEHRHWVTWTTFALLIGSCGAPPSDLVQTMPHPLRSSSGDVISTPAQWRQQRRPEILELFRAHMYGRAPAAVAVHIEDETEGIALGGKARRKQWRLRYADAPEAFFEVLLYLPNTAGGSGERTAAPVFLALNFFGNQSVHADPEIRMTTRWVFNDPKLKIQNNTASEALRGACAERWPIEKILARGYGIATVHYADIDPDYDDGFANGVHGIYDPKDRDQRPDDAWGSIGAWAWGLSRILDNLEQVDDVDKERVILLGHSRLGKTALWAGAQDDRFAMVIANDSGCGGAAYGRRRFGESIQSITKTFPHWFSTAFRAYADREGDLPIDQHLLIAAIAPRPAYVASAALDAWADPKGEFLSVYGADPVYRLLGTEGLPTDAMPGVDEPVQGQLGYHNRSGSHDLTWIDWQQFLAFADRHIKR